MRLQRPEHLEVLAIGGPGDLDREPSGTRVISILVWSSVVMLGNDLDPLFCLDGLTESLSISLVSGTLRAETETAQTSHDWQRNAGITCATAWGD